MAPQSLMLAVRTVRIGEWSNALLAQDVKGPGTPPRVLVLASAYLASNHVVSVLQPALDKLSADAQEISSMAILDGNDPEASYAALQKALHYVRTEKKPYLLEAMVSRLRGHSSASGANVVKGEVDCLDRFEQTLESRKLIDRGEIEKRRAALTQELLDAAQLIRNEPAPEPGSIWDNVFSEKNLVGGER